MKTIHPAVAEHALQESSRLQAENETLRWLLKCTLQYDLGGTLKGMIADALSQQTDHEYSAENHGINANYATLTDSPADTRCRVIEGPAPAQDERDSEISHIELCITNLKAEHQSNPRVIAEVLHNIGYRRSTRPAQTEQQPDQVKAFEALQHAVAYLSRSPSEAIHSGSALHKLMVAALSAQGGDA